MNALVQDCTELLYMDVPNDFFSVACIAISVAGLKLDPSRQVNIYLYLSTMLDDYSTFLKRESKGAPLRCWHIWPASQEQHHSVVVSSSSSSSASQHPAVVGGVIFSKKLIQGI